MSAPTVERTRPSRPRDNAPRKAASRTTGSRSDSARRTDSGAVGRAYARKAGRARPTADSGRIGAIGRSRFVLLVMGLLGSGLVASLWLSTSAAADSYRLDAASRATRDLSERSETLRSEIAEMRSAPALAQAARRLGMVPTSDVARLVAEPGGGVVVVGTPKAAYGPAPVMAPAPMPAAVPVVPGAVAGAVPNAGQPGAVPNSAPQPGAGAVTNQRGVVPSRPVGAPQAAAQASARPSVSQPSTPQPSTSRPTSQTGVRTTGGSRP